MATSLANASISKRDYIYHIPLYPLPNGTPIPYSTGLPDVNPLGTHPSVFEPTSTLVLTSAGKTFVDIRIFKPTKAGEPELPNEGGPRERLDWAFSGHSSSEPTADPFGSAQQLAGPVTKATWTHWLDSRHAVGTPAELVPKDEGIMYPINTLQTLEHGHGLNDSTGKLHSYEEMWTDLPILPTTPDTSIFNIVLRFDMPAAKARGTVIRLGRYCQGIFMVGGETNVERWEWAEKKAVVGSKGNSVDKGDWKRTAKIGSGFLPCATTFTPDTLSVGAVVKYFDYEWVCEELVEWNHAAGGR